jgi:hypothetical protein
MHARPSSVSGYALLPVEASGMSTGVNVVDVVPPDAVVLEPGGRLVVVSGVPAVVTVDGTVVVVGTALIVVVAFGAVVVVDPFGPVVLVVCCGDVDVVYGVVVVVLGHVVVVFGTVVGGGAVADLQRLLKIA